MDGAAPDRHPPELSAGRAGVPPAGLSPHLRGQRRRRLSPPAHERRLPPRRPAVRGRRFRHRLHFAAHSRRRVRVAGIRHLPGRGGDRPHHRAHFAERPRLGSRALAGRRPDRLHRDGPHDGHLPGGRPLRDGRGRWEPPGDRDRNGPPPRNRGLGGRRGRGVFQRPGARDEQPLSGAARRGGPARQFREPHAFRLRRSAATGPPSGSSARTTRPGTWSLSRWMRRRRSRPCT